MADATKELDFKFSSILIHLHLNVAAVSDGAVYITQRLFCIFTFYINFHALCMLLLLAYFSLNTVFWKSFLYQAR